MKIVEISNEDEKDWDEYILNHPKSTFYHQFGWRHVVEKSYGHKPIYLAAIQNDVIVGIFPIFLMKSLFLGKKLISIPFGAYGGPLSDNDKVYSALIRKGKIIADKIDVKFLEIRSNPYNGDRYGTNRLEMFSDHFVTFIMDLSIGKDKVWNNMNKKRRNAIRNSMKNNFSIENDKNSIDIFYDIYSLNVKRLGTPVHDKTFFLNIKKYFRDKHEIFNVTKGNVVVASSFLLFFKKEVISGWAGALNEFFNYNPNDFMYWKMIEYFDGEEYERFDFGRAIMDSGVYNFKKKWNVQEIPLNYQYYMIKGAPPTYDLSNSLVSRFTRIWKRMPSSVTNFLGPKLRKNIP